MVISKSTNILLIISLSLAIIACNNMQRGALIGGTAGTVAGAIAGKALGDTAKGAIIGAAIGGTAGAIIGNQMDRQAEELENSLEGAEVDRAGEAITIKFDSGLLFGFDSSDLSSTARTNLNQLAESLKKYDNTDVLVIGHTDSIGSEVYNQGLSERRANSATTFLVSQGINRARIISEGKGETEPIADNNTDEGRKLNRRVEIVIIASEDFQLEAQNN